MGAGTVMTVEIKQKIMILKMGSLGISAVELLRLGRGSADLRTKRWVDTKNLSIMNQVQLQLSVQ